MLFFLWFYVCTMYVLAFLCLIAVCQFFNKRILFLVMTVQQCWAD